VAKVKSSIPRGFTRYYVLQLIETKPMTGKEIIEKSEKMSEGAWIPSPGLIYPLLGRLFKDGLIEEEENGKFTITSKGKTALEKHSRVYEQLMKQLDLVMKLGTSMFTAGKIFAEESIDRIAALTTMVKSSISRSSSDLQKKFFEKYEAFLESELKKIRETKN
jgi:DNA-binding PadR family transcriptional regulator